MSNKKSHIDAVQAYYQWHAQLYDASRWAFLFGRKPLIERISGMEPPGTILELGCGTGTNLAALARVFPAARVIGVDVSTEMLRIARSRTRHCPNVTLAHTSAEAFLKSPTTYDLIVASYSLTMMGDARIATLSKARQHLSENGAIAVVDFDTTGFALFRRWMQANHVHMDGTLRSYLHNHFTVCHCKTTKAYRGLWNYFLFIGKR